MTFFSRSIAVALLIVMGFTHGGGYFFASKCSEPKQVASASCCSMDECCCKPSECHCSDHHHLQSVAAIMDPDCSPMKKIAAIGFDTSPIALSNLEVLFFIPEATSSISHTPSILLSDISQGLFRPPRA